MSLARKRRLTRLALWFERLWLALWPAFGVLGAYAAAALLGLQERLPPWTRLGLLAAVVAAVAWLLWRGLWLTLLGYLALAAAIVFLPDPWEGWAGIALQILLGFHAHDLERWTLRRRGYAMGGVVVGSDEEEATLRALRARPALARGMMA